MWWRKQKFEESMNEELRDYVERQTAANMAAGMSAEEARRQARLGLGAIEGLKESCREQRRGFWLETLWDDIRYGLRMLRKSPGFTAIAVLTLALGIGANAAIFTITYAVILKSLPVPSPEQLVRYTFRNGDQEIGLSGPLYDALRKHETTDQDLLAWSSSDLAVKNRETGQMIKVQGALVSGNTFRVLELEPFIGQTFGEASDVAGGGRSGYEALLSYTYWKQDFGASEGVLGQTLEVNGKEARIIGVLPAGFDGVVSGRRADIVLPLSFEEVLNAPNPVRRHPGAFWLTVMGRVRPRESLQAARADLGATEATVRKEADPSNLYLGGFFKGFGLGVESGRSGRSFLRVMYSQPLVALEILVALLLLLCCANTSLLVLARVASQFREFAVRSALGAPRSRLFRQVLSEVGLLAFAGLACGVVLGWSGARTLVSMLTAIGQPPVLNVEPQLAILGFTAAISVLAALAAGIWPAFRASSISPLLGLKLSGVSTQSKIVGRWIVPAQVAASVMLLAAASLFGDSLLDLLLVNSGFHTQGAVLADIDVSADKPDAVTSTRYAQQIGDALARVPGVEAAAAMSIPPIHNSWSAGHYFSLGRNGAVHTDMTLWGEVVTGEYFRAIGTPILEGRAFARADRTGDPVCVLSASAARYFFPNEEAIGRFVYAGEGDQNADGKAKVARDDTFRVIGVAADARFRSLHEAAPRMIYQLARHDELQSEFFLVARGSSAGITASAIRETTQRIVPGAPQPNVFTFDELVATHLSRERMLMGLSASFAVIALLLTVLGLYGLLARSVVLRRKEIGLRLALGAHPRDALSLVVRQGLRLVVVGALVGAGGALASVRLLQSLLFGVSATDPLILLAVVGVLFVVALAASCVPAWRAARIDPMDALRYD
ncbi:MAG TPA: ABC transporter permease [Candidatus Cybelea sp.]|nr:ABC transporter permease [Candidatus Cybelea sp.]